MAIEIKQTGMCAGCQHLDLEAHAVEFDDFFGGSRRTYNPTCSHMEICEYWWGKLADIQKEVGSEDDHK